MDSRESVPSFTDAELREWADSTTSPKRDLARALLDMTVRYRTQCELWREENDDRAKLIAENARLREALSWYGEKAESLAKKDWHKNPEYAAAIFTELALDGGKRSRA